MPIKIKTSDLKENMRFSAPVFFDDESFMLVDTGTPIKKRELDALARWNIPFVVTSGKIIDEGDGEAKGIAIEQKEPKNDEAQVVDPATLADAAALPDLSEFSKFKGFDWGESSSKESKKASAKPSSSTDAEQELKKQKTILEMLPAGGIEELIAPLKDVKQYYEYKALINELDNIFSSVKNPDSVAPHVFDNIVDNLCRFVKEYPTDAVSFILESDIYDKEMAKNAIHTGILSVIIAESIKVEPVKNVATGAILHNIGMLRVPDEITGKIGKLSESELEVMRAHSESGYKIIVDELMYSHEIALPASQHHECWDGSGYPSGIAGAEISIQARIVSAADAFEAMISLRPYRTRLSGYDAMKKLIADNGSRFDPDIIKAMIQNIGIYPSGSIVLMNNSSIARVAQVFPEMPLRPVINILIDESGQIVSESKLVDLRSDKSLFIARAISPIELSKSSSLPKHI